MPTGDLPNQFEKLRRLLQKIKYDRFFISERVLNGDPAELLPMLNYSLLGCSRVVAKVIAQGGYDFATKNNDTKFIEQVWKVCRNELKYLPKLTPAQFLTTGFAERKLMLVCDIIKLCMAKHNQLCQKMKQESATRKTKTAVEKNNEIVVQRLAKRTENAKKQTQLKKQNKNQQQVRAKVTRHETAPAPSNKRIPQPEPHPVPRRQTVAVATTAMEEVEDDDDSDQQDKLDDIKNQMQRKLLHPSAMQRIPITRNNTVVSRTNSECSVKSPFEDDIDVVEGLPTTHNVRREAKTRSNTMTDQGLEAMLAEELSGFEHTQKRKPLTRANTMSQSEFSQVQFSPAQSALLIQTSALPPVEERGDDDMEIEELDDPLMMRSDLGQVDSPEVNVQLAAGNVFSTSSISRAPLSRANSVATNITPTPQLSSHNIAATPIVEEESVEIQDDEGDEWDQLNTQIGQATTPGIPVSAKDVKHPADEVNNNSSLDSINQLMQQLITRFDNFENVLTKQVDTVNAKVILLEGKMRFLELQAQRTSAPAAKNMTVVDDAKDESIEASYVKVPAVITPRDPIPYSPSNSAPMSRGVSEDVRESESDVTDPTDLMPDTAHFISSLRQRYAETEELLNATQSQLEAADVEYVPDKYTNTAPEADEQVSTEQEQIDISFQYGNYTGGF